MGYLLLWIENLAVSLLFMAWLTACVAHWQRKWHRGLAWMIIVIMVIFVGFNASAVVTGTVKLFQPRNIPWFYQQILTLTICFLIGAILLLIKGLRRISNVETTLVASAWPRGKIFVACSVAFALLLMTFWNISLEIERTLSSLRTEAGAMAFSLAPPRIPDNENAALIYERAYEALRGSDLQDKWFDALDADPPTLDAKDTELTQFMQRIGGVILLLHEAANKPGCYFEHDFSWPTYSMLLREEQNLRDLAKVLAMHSFWMANNGDMHSALLDINSINALTESLGQEPGAVTTLMRVAIDRIACKALQNALKVANLPRRIYQF